MKVATKATRLVAAIILIAGVLALSACSAGKGQHLRIDDPAPDFKLQDLNGNTVTLSNFRGKAVFLNFWAISCPPCVAEMPHLQAFYNEWSSNNIVMLLINLQEDAATVKNFVQSHSYTFPVLLDSQHEVARKYAIQYTPTSFFIDKEGRIKLSIIGAFKDKAAIEKQLAAFFP